MGKTFLISLVAVEVLVTIPIYYRQFSRAFCALRNSDDEGQMNALVPIILYNLVIVTINILAIGVVRLTSSR